MVDSNRQQSSAPLDSNAMQSFSGGLNTAAGALSLPRGDSPYLWNMFVNDKGHSQTRGGTRALISESYSNAVGDNSTIVKTNSGKLIHVRKYNRSVDINYIYNADDGNYYFQRIYFKTIFPASTSKEKVDFVLTAESVPRLIMTSGLTAPHQLSFVETSVEVTEASSFTQFDLEGEYLEFCDKDDCAVFINDIIYDVTAVSYSAGTLTVTIGTSIPAGTYTITFLWITYQWWCQATLLEGKDIYDTALRFNASATDTAVEIPVNLLRNVEQFSNGNYSIRVLSSADRSDHYDNISGGGVAGSSEFAFSAGAIYESGKIVANGLGFVTFGGLDASGNPSEVHYLKQIDPGFNGGEQMTGTGKLTVRVNGTDATLRDSTNITAGSFTNTDTKGTSYTVRNGVSIYTESGGVAAASGDWDFVDFGSAEVIGVDYNAVVEIAWLNKSGVTDSGNSSETLMTPGKYRDGYAVPAYGLQEHTDYRSATLSMPRNVALFQGRLVFAGFPNNPDKIVFSEVVGTGIGPYDYQNFQTLESEATTTSPFVVELSSGENNGSITAVSSSAGSLLVFTEQRVHRVYGGSDSALSALSSIVSIVANVGCVNRFSAIEVNNAVFFLSKSGLFRVAPSLEIGDFAVRFVSSKVNNKLKNSRNTLCSYLTYNFENERLYVAVADTLDAEIASRLFVYSVNKDSWSEYNLFYGKWFSAHACCYDSLTIIGTTFVYNSTGSVASWMLLLNQDLNIDFVTPNVDSVTSSNTLHQVSESITLSNSAEVTGQYRLTSFRMCEFLGVEDVGVIKNGERLTFGDDFRKINEYDIAITTPLFVGDTLTIFPVGEDGTYPFIYGKYLDDLQCTVDIENPNSGTNSEDVVNWSTTSTVTGTTWTFLGYAIPYYEASPVFVRNDLTGMVWSRDAFVVVDNSDFQYRWDYNSLLAFTSVLDDDDIDLATVVSQWRYPVSLRIGKVFNVTDYTSDLLSGNIINTTSLWDFETYDLDSSNRQSQRLSRIGFPIKGTDDTLQFFVSSYSNNKRFEIVAYQLIAQTLKRSLR